MCNSWLKPSALEKPDRITKPHAAADFGGDVFDEGYVVKIQFVVQVIAADGKDIGRVLAGDGV